MSGRQGRKSYPKKRRVRYRNADATAIPNADLVPRHIAKKRRLSLDVIEKIVREEGKDA